MLTERHFQGTFFWPTGYRTAVTMTFDFQGGEDVRPLPDGSMDHEEYTQCEYGPHTGIWRILLSVRTYNAPSRVTKYPVPVPR